MAAIHDYQFPIVCLVARLPPGWIAPPVFRMAGRGEWHWLASCRPARTRGMGRSAVGFPVLTGRQPAVITWVDARPGTGHHPATGARALHTGGPSSWNGRFQPASLHQHRLHPLQRRGHRTSQGREGLPVAPLPAALGCACGRDRLASQLVVLAQPHRSSQLIG
jgi:hypothetical protein